MPGLLRVTRGRPVVSGISLSCPQGMPSGSVMSISREAWSSPSPGARTLADWLLKFPRASEGLHLWLLSLRVYHQVSNSVYLEGRGCVCVCVYMSARQYLWACLCGDCLQTHGVTYIPVSELVCDYVTVSGAGVCTFLVVCILPGQGSTPGKGRLGLGFSSPLPIPHSQDSEDERVRKQVQLSTRNYFITRTTLLSGGKG